MGCYSQFTTWTFYASIIFWQIIGASPALSLRGCDGNPYCQDEDGEVRWHNDCGIERPSKEVFEKHKHEDTRWLRSQMDKYLDEQRRRVLDRDEKTFPAWLSKRYAPDHSPSSMMCDGLGSCIAPSCKDIGKHHSPEIKRAVLLFFDEISVLDHTRLAMTEACQDFFIGLSLDIDWTVKTFSYTDEMQDKAKERKAKRDMILNLITGFILAGTAVTGTGALWGGAITSGVSKWMAKAPFARYAGVAGRASKGVQSAAGKLKLPGEGAAYGQGMAKQMGNLNSAAGGIVAGAFIGITGLMKETQNIQHGKDEEGFDKFLLSFKHHAAGLANGAADVVASEMVGLSMGRKTANGKDLVDLFASGFYSDPNVNLRGHIKHMLTMYYSAMIISALWETEGVWITASPVLPGSTCEQDTQGKRKGRICLAERPDMVYYIRVASVHDDGKIHLPPGIDVLLSEQGFNGLYLEDFVRGPLFNIEVWEHRFKGKGDPDIETLLEQSSEQPTVMLKRHLEDRDVDALGLMREELDREVLHAKTIMPDDHIKVLDHYGQVPGAVSIAVCHSWSGEAISDVNSSHNTNGPCLCDPPARSLARPWSDPSDLTMAYTRRFLRDSKLYENNKFGKMCRKHNKCKKNGKWEDQLNLSEGHEVAKEMKDAWRSCKHPRGHGDHDPGEPSAEEPPTPVKTREPISVAVFFPDAQETPTLTTDYYRESDGSIRTSVRTIAGQMVTAWFPNPKLQPHLETQEWLLGDRTVIVTTMVTPTP